MAHLVAKECSTGSARYRRKETPLSIRTVRTRARSRLSRCAAVSRLLGLILRVGVSVLMLVLLGRLLVLLRRRGLGVCRLLVVVAWVRRSSIVGCGCGVARVGGVGGAGPVIGALRAAVGLEMLLRIGRLRVTWLLLLVVWLLRVWRSLRSILRLLVVGRRADRRAGTLGVLRLLVWALALRGIPLLLVRLRGILGLAGLPAEVALRRHCVSRL